MDNVEAQLLNSGGRKKGGWVTFPFIIATRAGLTIATAGFSSNLIVYLINVFHVKSIDAAQIFNVVNGSMALFPLVVAIIADSFLGCFNAIWISSMISSLGMILFTITATISSLSPRPCNEGSSFCEPPSAFQFTILYLAVALASIGFAGTCFTVGTMGANQLDDPNHQENFFNWFLFVWNAASVISATGIVYVQDNVSWGLGYGICVAANMLGLLIFLLGKHFYRDVRAQGSNPIRDLARVVVAAISKRKLPLSKRSEDYYSELCDDGADEEQVDGVRELVAAIPDESFKFLNHAALVTQSDFHQTDESIKPLWKLCTVQQVEDLKALLRIAPLWTTGVFLETPMAVLSTLSTLQALTMDCNLTTSFKIPVGSMGVFLLLAGAIFLTFIDRLLFPLCKKLMGKSPTPLQRVGIGHVINVLAIAIGAVVESKRLALAGAYRIRNSTDSNSVVPMSVLWLVPQLSLIGIGEAFHFPGHASLYYQEFPASLKSTSTAMLAMLMAIGYYLGTALIDLVRGVTSWLPDNLNFGRLDNVYWMLVVIGGLNFGYYLICARLYRSGNDEENEDDDASTVKNLLVL